MGFLAFVVDYCFGSSTILCTIILVASCDQFKTSAYKSQINKQEASRFVRALSFLFVVGHGKIQEEGLQIFKDPEAPSSW
jgi:hypothetical protein